MCVCVCERRMDWGWGRSVVKWLIAKIKVTHIATHTHTHTHRDTGEYATLAVGRVRVSYVTRPLPRTLLLLLLFPLAHSVAEAQRKIKNDDPLAPNSRQTRPPCVTHRCAPFPSPAHIPLCSGSPSALLPCPVGIPPPAYAGLTLLPVNPPPLPLRLSVFLPSNNRRLFAILWTASEVFAGAVADEQ